MTTNVFGFFIFFQIYSLSVRLWFPLHCPSMPRCLNSCWHIQFWVHLLKRRILPFVKYAQWWELSENTITVNTLIIKLYIATNVLQSKVFKHIQLVVIECFIPIFVKQCGYGTYDHLTSPCTGGEMISFSVSFLSSLLFRVIRFGRVKMRMCTLAILAFIVIT